jgi:23S rRNA maturation-related 3'-5' exoribonuclease YhaM
MTLSDLELAHGTRFKVACRVRHPLRKIATNGSRYLCCTIEDCEGSIKAYAWPEQCDLSMVIHDLDKVVVEGRLREFNGDILAAVTSIQPLVNSDDNSVELIPHSACQKPDLLVRLADLCCKLSNEGLTSFVNSVFSDDSLALPFIRRPASRSHHHSVPGGLLEHSLECAEMVQHISIFDPNMRELAVVAALLHNIGKIVTLRVSDGFCLEGAVLDHNALTLELLAPHLKRLDGINKELATALRYLWTWRHHRRASPHPILTIAEAITAADRISTGIDVEKAAFQDRPDWQRITRWHHNNLLWRPDISYHEVQSRQLTGSVRGTS